MSGAYISKVGLEDFVRQQCGCGWNLTEFNDNYVVLAYGLTIKGHGEYVYSLIIDAEKYGNNKAVRIFNSCVLLGPRCKVRNSICDKQVELHRWLTFRGMTKGMHSFFEKEVKTFKYMVNRYGFE